jgi:hypothetical protein
MQEAEALVWTGDRPGDLDLVLPQAAFVRWLPTRFADLVGRNTRLASGSEPIGLVNLENGLLGMVR